MEETDAIQLLQKYREGTATEAERALLESWYNQHGQELPELDEYIDYPTVEARIWASIEAQRSPWPNSKTRNLWPRIAAAASIILALSAGTYFLLKPKQHQPIQLAKGEETMPLQQGVILTTGSGQKIALNQQFHGQVKTQDGTQAKQDENTLAYQREEKTAPVTHTLTNNSGHKFNLTLADGTEVFLDAASTVTYPTAFPGKERRIAVTGQAYLKVKHNNNQPFRVDVQNETVEDIGTEFNINAYGDRPGIRTTLVEGSARILLPATQQAVTLKPGQQAILNDTELEIKPADLEEVTAWLQGKLVFTREPLENIMKKISRIYNVDVVWIDADLKKLEIGGSTNTTKKLANVLNFFRKTGQVDFSVEGKTVKVFKPKH